jgi:hypothetical protein
MTTSSSTSLDLSKEFPHSPRATLAGYVIAARTLDKCRAVIAGTAGEYHFDCPLDQLFLTFAGITAENFKAFVATGADNAAVAEWIQATAIDHTQEALVQWNNDLRTKRISEMPIELQLFLEGYVAEFIPSDKIVYTWFDVYDIEEQRI